MSAPLPELLTVQQVAEWLHSTPQAVYDLRRRSLLPQGVRVGSRLLFDRAELLRWWEERKRNQAG
jgi:predicted DNA-binding transcriptional regulator AlpA